MAQAPGLNPWLQFTQDEASGFERLQSDVQRTSLLEGREFRIFKELNIAVGATYVMKLVLPSDIILNGAETQLDSGWLRISVAVGGAEGGSFSETLTRFACNGMSLGANRRAYDGAAFQPLMVITAGGTHTGGTETEVVRNKVASNSNQAVTVGGHSFDERGAAAGTYYFRFQNISATDAVTGVFRLRWEEHP